MQDKCHNYTIVVKHISDDIKKLKALDPDLAKDQWDAYLKEEEELFMITDQCES